MIKLLWDPKNRNFQRLWWAQLISQFGDRVNQLALVGLIAERSPGSATELAKVLAFTIIPVFLIQPFAGVFVDRWDRRLTLFVCDIVRGVLVLLIPLFFMKGDTMIPLYIIVFLVFCFSRFYFPAKMSIIPDLVEGDSLLMANSLVSTTGMLAFVAGCALGGLLVEHLGSRNGFIVDGATFFISGLFVFSIDLSRRLKIDKERIFKAGREWAGPIRQSVGDELKEGFRYLVRHEELRFILGMIFTVLSAGGAVYVVIIVFVQEAFGSVTKDLGLLAVCLGAGLLGGTVLYGRWGKRLVWYKTMFLCLVVGGVTLTAFAVLVYHYPNLFMAMALAALLGVITGPIFICANTMIHVVTDEKMRGKVFSALEIVIHGAFLAAMLVSSWLSEIVAEVWILCGIGVIFSCVGMAGLRMKPKFVEWTPIS